jgi:hypothetical protein
LGEWTDAIAQHHERFDGSGYPNGLVGDEIGLGARIVAVADTFDVMTSPRAYKPALAAETARHEISGHAGDLFDPVVVRALLNVSVGRLRWGIGPFAWIAASPLLLRARAQVLPLQQAAAAALAGAAGGALAAVLMAAPVALAPAAAGAPPGGLVVPSAESPRADAAAGQLQVSRVAPSATLPAPPRARASAEPRAARTLRPGPSLSASRVGGPIAASAPPYHVLIDPTAKPYQLELHDPAVPVTVNAGACLRGAVQGTVTGCAAITPVAP